MQESESGGAADRALLARINLALKGQRRQVRRSRPRSRARQELGTYYLVRLGRDTEEVVERDVHLKTKARELGVRRAYALRARRARDRRQATTPRRGGRARRRERERPAGLDLAKEAATLVQSWLDIERWTNDMKAGTVRAVERLTEDLRNGWRKKFAWQISKEGDRYRHVALTIAGRSSSRRARESFGTLEEAQDGIRAMGFLQRRDQRPPDHADVVEYWERAKSG